MSDERITERASDRTPPVPKRTLYPLLIAGLALAILQINIVLLLVPRGYRLEGEPAARVYTPRYARVPTYSLLSWCAILQCAATAGVGAVCGISAARGRDWNPVVLYMLCAAGAVIPALQMAHAVVLPDSRLGLALTSVLFDHSGLGLVGATAFGAAAAWCIRVTMR